MTLLLLLLVAVAVAGIVCVGLAFDAACSSRPLPPHPRARRWHRDPSDTRPWWHGPQ